MKHVFATLLLTLSVVPLTAQTSDDDTERLDGATGPAGAVRLDASSLPDDAVRQPLLCDPYSDTGITLWHTPYLGCSPMTMPLYRPSHLAPYLGGMWDIHNGLNASVDMGVSVGFGKHNPWRGAHFFTSVTALYAYPVNDRLTLAAGADYSTFTGLGGGCSSVGLFGLANYRINDRLDVTGFVEHDFGPLSSGRFSTRMPYVPGMMGPSTTIGADLGIKVGENTKINVGVSFTREQDVPSFMQNPQGMRQPQRNDFPGRDK